MGLNSGFKGLTWLNPVFSGSREKREWKLSTVSWRRPSGASLSPWKPGFNPRQIQVELAVHNAVFDRFLLSFSATAPQWARASSFTRVLITHNDAPQSVGLLWTSDQLVAQTSTWQHTTNIHAPVGFEPTILAGERPQTWALDRAATGTGCLTNYSSNICYPLSALFHKYSTYYRRWYIISESLTL